MTHYRLTEDDFSEKELDELGVTLEQLLQVTMSKTVQDLIELNTPVEELAQQVIDEEEIKKRFPDYDFVVESVINKE